MKKLEDIPQKSIFRTPEGYFDELPLRIQTRLEKQSRTSLADVVLRYSLRVVPPVAALAILAVVWFRPAPSIETQLGEIHVNQIALYLDEADTQNDEGHDTTGFTATELDDLEDAVYSQMDYSETDDILEGIDLDNL